jgi:hypothetical protein
VQWLLDNATVCCDFSQCAAVAAGFPLRLSQQQADARARCESTEKKATKAWFKYAKKGQVPSGEDRKTLCRKVRADEDMTARSAAGPLPYRHTAWLP